MRNRSQVHVYWCYMDPSLVLPLTMWSNQFFLMLLTNAVSVVHWVSLKSASIWLLCCFIDAYSLSRDFLLHFHERSLLNQWALHSHTTISVHSIINEISHTCISGICKGRRLGYYFTNEVLQVHLREISDLINREVLLQKFKDVVMRSSWIVYQ